MNIHTDQIYRASSDEQGEIRNEINLQLNYFNNKKDFLQCGSSVVSTSIIDFTNEPLIWMYRGIICTKCICIQVGTKLL